MKVTAVRPIKILILILLLLVLCPPPTKAAGVITSSCSNGNGAGNASCAITLQANQIVIVTNLEYFISSTPSDTKGLTYGTVAFVTAFLTGAHNHNLYIYCAATGANTGSDTITVNSTGFGAYIIVAQYSGTDNLCTANGTAGTGSGTTGGAATLSTTSTTTTKTDLVLAPFFTYPNTGTVGSGWTLQITLSAVNIVYLQDKSSAASSTYTGTLVDPGPAGDIWLGIVVGIPLAPVTTFRNHSSFIKHRIPMDIRRRKLEIVRI